MCTRSTGFGLRLCHVVIRFSFIQCCLADELLCEQLLRTLVVQLGIAQRSLRLRHLCIASRDGLIRFTLVDAQDDLAFAHAVTHIEQDRFNATRYLCRHRCLPRRFHYAVHTIGLLHFAELHRNGCRRLRRVNGSHKCKPNQNA